MNKPHGNGFKQSRVKGKERNIVALIRLVRLHQLIILTGKKSFRVVPQTESNNINDIDPSEVHTHFLPANGSKAHSYRI